MKKYTLPLRLGTLALLWGFFAFTKPATVNAAEWRPENPTISSDNVSTWDCLYFGTYWQNDTNQDGIADEKDEKEYIKWRVLSVDGDDAFLVADQNLDVKPYNTTYEEVTWKTCTLRSWLNGYDASLNKTGSDYTQDNFINVAFDETEQEAILLTTVLNISPTDQVVLDTETEDKIYLLSIEEIENVQYGFTKENRFEPGEMVRHCTNTAYVANKPHMAPENPPTFWWLRTQGKNLWYASFLRTYGFYSQNGINVDVSYIGVRPALHLDLSKSDCYFDAGKVSSDGTVTEPETKPVAAASLSNTVQQISTTCQTEQTAQKEKKTYIIGNNCYKITGENTVSWTGVKKQKKKVTIPATIKINKKRYLVTAIAANACKKNKTVKTLTIGSNVDTIGKNAFSGCKKLSVIKVKKSTLKKVNPHTWDKLSKKATVKLYK